MWRAEIRDGGPQAGEKRLQVEAREVGRERDVDPEKVAPDRLEKGHPRGAAGRVDQRPVDERDAEARDQRRKPFPAAPAKMLRRAGAVQGEGRPFPSRAEVDLDGKRQAPAELGDVVALAERRRLVEPLRKRELRGDAADRGAVHLGADPDDQLRAGLQRRRAEAERHPEAEIPLLDVDLEQAQGGHQSGTTTTASNSTIHSRLASRLTSTTTLVG